MKVEGLSATVELDAESVTITHRGVLGFLTVGMAGSRKIFLTEITSVQIKEANMMINGFIRFGTRGTDHAAGIMEAGQDPGAIFFRRPANGAFLNFKAAVERAIQAARTKPANIAAPAASFADELEKLASLRDRGILSATEFEAQKAALLARNL